MPKAAVKAPSAFNALLVLTTMKSIADAAYRKPWDEVRHAGGIQTPTARLSSFDQEWLVPGEAAQGGRLEFRPEGFKTPVSAVKVSATKCPFGAYLTDIPPCMVHCILCRWEVGG